MMRAILCCPPSSAGVERPLSSTALVHTNPRNRLANDIVAKTVRVWSYWIKEKKYHLVMMSRFASYKAKDYKYYGNISHVTHRTRPANTRG